MAKQNQSGILSMRPTKADFKLLETLRKKLGVDTSQIVRLALRALATKEGIAA